MKMNTAELIKNITFVPDFSANRIKNLMKRLDVDEKGLALIMNVLPATVKLWVNSVSRPCTTARRMLFLIETEPKVIEIIAQGGRMRG